jgi:hypothetical protein
MAEMTYCGKVLVRGFIFPRLREEGGSQRESNTHRAADKIRKKNMKQTRKIPQLQRKEGRFYVITYIGAGSPDGLGFC